MDQTPQTHQINIKAVAVAVVVLAILAVAYFTLVGRTPSPVNQGGSASADEGAVEVVSTPLVDGKVQPPAGLPVGVPYEADNLTESATTNFPEQGTRQLALAYTSSKSIEEVYNQHLSYIIQQGYSVSEGESSSPVRTMFGTKEDSTLSVAISSQEGRTFVQLSYLVKTGE